MNNYLKDILQEIIRGYKAIGIFILWVAYFAIVIWAILCILLMLGGKVGFYWWYIPCWFVLLSSIAGAIGSMRR